MSRWASSTRSLRPSSGASSRSPAAPSRSRSTIDGTVLAKGTFNNLAQLESVLATAARRRAEGVPEAGTDPAERTWGGCRSVPEHLDRFTDSLARDTSRRGFLARVGGALVALTAARTVGTLIEPGESEAFHFCGHTFTTGSCPHPTGLPRIDSRGFPLRASDGQPIDDIGRPVNEAGQPVDDDGQPAARRATAGRCRPAPADAALRAGRGDLRLQLPHRRLLVPLLRRQGPPAARLLRPSRNTRINGDAALTGYCYGGRKVFCVQYYDTRGARC